MPQNRMGEFVPVEDHVPSTDSEAELAGRVGTEEGRWAVSWEPKEEIENTLQVTPKAAQRSQGQPER